jgi:hypothetical protein
MQVGQNLSVALKLWLCLTDSIVSCLALTLNGNSCFSVCDPSYGRALVTGAEISKAHTIALQSRWVGTSSPYSKDVLYYETRIEKFSPVHSTHIVQCFLSDFTEHSGADVYSLQILTRCKVNGLQI